MPRNSILTGPPSALFANAFFPIKKYKKRAIKKINDTVSIIDLFIIDP